MRARWVVATLTVIVLGGCATGSPQATDRTNGSTAPSGTAATESSAPGAPSSSPPASPGGESELPVLEPPSGAPRTPTDQIPVHILVGRIVPGGGGPWCYTMETDDALIYALIGGDGTALAPGTTVKVTIEPATAAPARPVGCDGAPVSIVKLEIIA